MTQVKVLVVDGSVTMRKRIGDAVKADETLSLVGVAQNESIALQKISNERPDALVVDADLDGSDISEFVRKLAIALPGAKIVLFGRSTQRGSSCVLDLISAGATDYLLKPSVSSLSDPAWSCIEKDLIPKLHGIVSVRAEEVVRSKERGPKVLEKSQRAIGDHIRRAVGSKKLQKVAKYRGDFELLCIGSSTGGPNALATVFRSFSSKFPVPILITQHMPPMFTGMLAKRLNGLDTLRFHEAIHGMIAERGHAYIAPGGFHMTVARRSGKLVLELNEEAPENSCRPAVDVMLRSVAECVGGATLVAILTGMGKDGCQGCDVLAGLGATVFAQDEDSSVVWGMPGFVSAEGLADAVLPLGSISERIHRAFRCPFPVGHI